MADLKNIRNMNVEWVDTYSLVPYPGNAKKHPEEQVQKIANSINAFGWRQPIVIDKDNVVVIGHGRLLAAKLLKIDKVPIVRAADMSEDDIKAMRLADNKTNESDWDMSALENELQALEISGIDMSLFGFDKLEETSDSNPYTGTTNIPQYEPTGENVTIDGLVESFKTDSLLNEIEESSVTEEEKEFLRLAAQRHLAFNYKKIAEYYANASEEMQELMEKSALVIIDYKDAIANGFTRLTDTITEMFEDWEG